MRFALSDDQLSFRDAVRDLLAKECTPAVARAAWDAPAGQLDRGVWDSLDAMGVLGVLVAESDGGLGLDETFLVPILEECGRVALPHPIVETAMVAAPLVGLGNGMVSTDLGGPVIPCAADADVLLLRFPHTPDVGPDGGQRLLVQTDTSGAVLPAVTTVDRARRGAAIAAPASPTPNTTDGPGLTVSVNGRSDETTLGRLEHVTDDPAAVELALDRGALGTAAVLIGLGQAMLDMTVAYVREREQFGKPIGSFQAVKHHLADAALALELARPAVWRAAWSVAHEQPTRGRDVSMAKAMGSDAAELVGRRALQCHGAIGYTVEADLHLFMKRAWALARAWGDSAHHTDRVATALGT